MREIKESQFGKNLSTTMGSEFSKVSNLMNPSDYDSSSLSDMSDTKDKFKRAVDEDKTPIIKRKIKKSQIKDLVGNKKMNLPIGKVFSMKKTETKENKKTTKDSIKMTKKEVEEKWSQKYKDSVDCTHPKGFSQRAHCQGKKKKETKEATGSGSAGGFLAPVGFNPNSKFVKDSFKETPKKVETKEATGSGSAGAYVTPAAWAKSTKKKHWRGKSKTQIPGGQFVQVKKECKTFPYCNQGDINALNLTNEQKLDKIVSELSEKYNISEQYIKKLLIQNLHKGKR
jgi:hypothetical protein